MREMVRMRAVRLALVAALAAVVGALAATSSANGGTVTGSTVLSATEIACAGSVDVTVSLTGESSVVGSAQDVVLVLDRSGSMAGQRLTDMKAAANQLVDLLDRETDGALDGVIANGSRVGVVSFAGTATTDLAPTTDAAAAKAAVNAIVASGATNHGAAIGLAQTLFGGNGRNMVVVTDGQTTTGPDPSVAAANARAGGTTIFTIGLGISSASAAWAALRDWADDAAGGTRAFLAPTSAELEAIFGTIGAAIVVPAATGISLTDTVAGDFSVSGVSATRGTASVTGNVVTWTLDELGTETATLTYTATHIAAIGGLKQVSSVSYADDQGNTPSFGDASVFVTCSSFDRVTTCEGAACETTGSLPTSVPGQSVNVTASVEGFEPGAQVVQASLGATAPVCAGFRSILGTPGAQLDVLPLSDRLVVRIEISKALRKKLKFGIGHLGVCLESNLPFTTANGTLSPEVSPGRYAGLLPKGLTVTNGNISPHITKRDASNGGGAVVEFEVRAPYDPRWWGP